MAVTAWIFVIVVGLAVLGALIAGIIALVAGSRQDR